MRTAIRELLVRGARNKAVPASRSRALSSDLCYCGHERNGGHVPCAGCIKEFNKGERSTVCMRFVRSKG